MKQIMIEMGSIMIIDVMSKKCVGQNKIQTRSDWSDVSSHTAFFKVYDLQAELDGTSINMDWLSNLVSYLISQLSFFKHYENLRINLHLWSHA